MIEAKDAVQNAISEVRGFFPNARDIRLEEIEEHLGAWMVVVSFETGVPTTLAHVIGGSSRLFKTLKIDGETGKFVALKVWRQ